MKTNTQILRKISSLQKEYDAAKDMYDKLVKDAYKNFDDDYVAYEIKMEKLSDMINLLKWTLK